jgi:AraC-like DNA-binding protein
MDAITERLALFRELLQSVNPYFSLTELDNHYDTISGETGERQAIWSMFFGFSKRAPSGNMAPESLLRGHVEPTPAPFVFTNTLGMTWLSDHTVKDGKVQRICILGPVFLDDVTPEQIERKASQLPVSMTAYQTFMDVIRKMPVITLRRLTEYGIMLHRCLTGNSCTASDFVYPDLVADEKKSELPENHVGNYRAESELLRIVEEGNIAYIQEKNALMHQGDTERAIGGSGDYLRQAKNTVIIFITLCSRAALKGGLSPDTAYNLADSYVSMAERAETLAKVNEISQSMYTDFVRRVFRQKAMTKQMSPVVLDTCNYINMHLQEKMDIHQLAVRTGYTDYYFSYLFRKDAGQGVRDYILERKIDKAQEMLRDMSLDVNEIATRLGFETHSHFSDAFRKRTGMSPSKWRVCHDLHAADISEKSEA